MHLTVPPLKETQRIGRYFLLAIGMASLGFVGRASAAPPEPATILQKMFTTYQNAKTLSVSTRTHQKGYTMQNKVTSYTVLREIKAKSPNLFYEHSTVLLPSQPPQQRIMCSDGHITTFYDGSRNLYQQLPADRLAPPVLVFIQSIDPLLGAIDTPKAHMEKITNYQGQAAYVISAPLKLRSDVSAATRARIKPLKLTIAQSNYHLLHISDPNAYNPTSLSLDIEILSQQLNASLPDSLFRFIPPKGAQRVQPQAPPRPNAPKPNP